MELAGTEVPVVWHGRRLRAFAPQLLAERDLTLSARAAARCGAAEESLSQGAASLGDDHAPLARLLLRAEGVASSFIEGVTAPVVEVVLAEGNDGAHSPAAWVAANAAAGEAAIAHAKGTDPLDVEELCRWHEALMAGSPTPAHHVGCVRKEQGWIGGPTPFEAHLVTPPANMLNGLLADLLGFVNSTGTDAVAAAAIAHAQFEIVHPFADGNGRIGRVLVSWLLTRRLHLLTPPPVSVRLAADVGGYTAGLTQFRFGQTDAWVAWIADGVSGAGRAQQQLVGDAERMRGEWEATLSTYGKVRRLRSDAGARRVLDLLPRHLVLSAPIVADALGLSRQSAGTALRVLADAGILTPYRTDTRSRRGRAGAALRERGAARTGRVQSTAPIARRPASARLIQPVHGRGQIEVLVGEPTSRVRAEPQGDRVPTDLDVGVVVRRLGERTHRVHVGEGPDEAVPFGDLDELVAVAIPCKAALGDRRVDRGVVQDGAQGCVISSGRTAASNSSPVR